MGFAPEGPRGGAAPHRETRLLAAQGRTRRRGSHRKILGIHSRRQIDRAVAPALDATLDILAGVYVPNASRAGPHDQMANLVKHGEYPGFHVPSRVHELRRRRHIPKRYTAGRIGAEWEPSGRTNTCTPNRSSASRHARKTADGGSHPSCACALTDRDCRNTAPAASGIVEARGRAAFGASRLTAGLGGNDSISIGLRPALHPTATQRQ